MFFGKNQKFKTIDIMNKEEKENKSGLMKYMNKKEHYETGYLDGYDDAREDAKTAWIDVNKFSPKKDVEVLVLTLNNFIDIVHLEDGYWKNRNLKTISFEDAPYWMELPKPLKKD